MNLHKLWVLVPIFCFSVIFSGFQPEKSFAPENDSWPEASSYLEGVPVYEKFSELESLFQFENDTTYVINFWATWCKPCIEELPYFESLHKKYQDKKVRVVLVSLDFDLSLEVPFGQARRHLDDLGNGRVAADGDGRVACLGAGSLDCAANRLTDRLGVDDGFFTHRTRRSRLRRVRLHAVALTALRELYQLDRRGRYIETQQWLLFVAEKHVNFLLSR